MAMLSVNEQRHHGFCLSVTLLFCRIAFTCTAINQSGFINIDLQCGQSKVCFLPIFFIDCCDSFWHTGQVDKEVISVI